MTEWTIIHLGIGFALEESYQMVKLWDINNYSSGGFKDVPGKSSNQKVIGYPIPGTDLYFLIVLNRISATANS